MVEEGLRGLCTVTFRVSETPGQSLEMPSSHTHVATVGSMANSVLQWSGEAKMAAYALTHRVVDDCTVSCDNAYSAFLFVCLTVCL